MPIHISPSPNECAIDLRNSGSAQLQPLGKPLEIAGSETERAGSRAPAALIGVKGLADLVSNESIDAVTQRALTQWLWGGCDAGHSYRSIQPKMIGGEYDC